MSTRLMSAAKAVALFLVFVTAAAIPADAGQGKGQGKGRGRGNGGVPIIERQDSTPGVPTSSRGRGRYTNRRTPRGRFIRTIINTNINRSNPDPGTPRRRRVRRGHSRH